MRFFKAKSTIIWSISWLLLVTGSIKAQTEDDLFPVYDSIKPNISFWKNVYSRYSSLEGIIHDSENLSVVYEVIRLVPRSKKGSYYLNRRRISQCKKKYARILEQLAEHGSPQTDEQKRVYRLFGDKAQPAAFLAAKGNIRYQRGQKDRFRAGLARSGAYLDEIKRIFRRYDLPEDLVYLPHVESSFHFNAYSKFGAAGIWQFTYSTGKRLMTVNYTVDERWDPIRASDAAARLLKRNYEKLGSWPLALTAYNHGAGGMAQAKRLHGNYEEIFLSYDGYRFKFASRNFYSDFLAAREVAKNHADYFPGIRFNPPLKTRSVKIEGFAPIDRLAEHFGVSIEALRRLNRSLREPVFRGQKYVPKGFVLQLPELADFETKAASIPQEIYHQKQKRSQFYYVRKGDVASVIARRHGVSLNELIRANNLDHQATIYAGQNLRIPSPGDQPATLKTAGETAEQLAESGQEVVIAVHNPNMKNQAETVKKVKRVHLPEPSPINPAVVTGNFMVKRVYRKNDRLFGVISVETGETLGHYAEWLEVSAQDLRRLNGLPFGREIHMHQNLVIPLHRVSKTVFEEKRYEYHQEFEEDFLHAYRIEGVGRYEIQRGENIWNLCTETFELPVWLVKKYNQTIALDRLMPGQTIWVPMVERVEEPE